MTSHITIIPDGAPLFILLSIYGLSAFKFIQNFPKPNIVKEVIPDELGYTYSSFFLNKTIVFLHRATTILTFFILFLIISRIICVNKITLPEFTYYIDIFILLFHPIVLVIFNLIGRAENKIKVEDFNVFAIKNGTSSEDKTKSMK